MNTILVGAFVRSALQFIVIGNQDGRPAYETLEVAHLATPGGRIHVGLIQDEIPLLFARCCRTQVLYTLFQHIIQIHSIYIKT